MASNGTKTFTRTVGLKEYELKDHLGNVRAVVSDTKSGSAPTFYDALASGTYHYYPFGMAMPGLGSVSGQNAYRYGYNGKEKDADMKGSDATYDYGFRIYDARIAKFLSVDPLTKSYPWYTPYQFAGNTPIMAIDLDGLEPYPAICRQWASNSRLKTQGLLTNEDIKVIDNRNAKIALGGLVNVGLFFGGVVAAPYVAAEFSLLAETSWGSLPIVSNYITGFGEASLSAGLFDAGGQFAANTFSNRIGTGNWNILESAKDVNLNSSFLSTINPSNLMVNGFASSLINISAKSLMSDQKVSVGTPSQILFGTFGELGFGKYESFFSGSVNKS
ncbi:RHS repeat domain-containing protein [Williamwhitmania taraxaci]|uniref:RHS repeat-associated core domain-containing protein n=1 Tax=Williamwhitmania taraxaci TaxID=1640674 RepID=A0A1G6U7V4_9BACT|nr:RHS repeat-associated core domain-containing protein [Williamwhitmania taraxaci]SDD37379.1 RHS repeat-associated core domain-containing protein [Williamwhitmania taraxaci]